MNTIYILNGPNLNLLGSRETSVYGTETIASLAERCHKRGKGLGLTCDFRQSNSEGQMIDWIHEAKDRASAILINAGGYTHTSVAIHDALRAVALPTVEVHLSNIYKREPFRHHSYVSLVAEGVICGMGGLGYELALEALAAHLKSARKA
ncbi:MAG: type II 3-dehydroquinate dehydratase [Rhizobiales bacterium]|nr:type II 3-dehydroquinate dehydratase [Hyphomicrobiales bacterium]